MKENERKKMFWIVANILYITCICVLDIVREKKVTYITCCIVFKMNSCEFARTTIIVHSTAILFVISKEQEQNKQKEYDDYR